MRRVAFTQPYVPAYRVKLFELVAARLLAENVEMRVFYPTPTERRIARGDLTTASWTQEVRGRTVRTLAGPVAYLRLPRPWSRPDLLVTELAAGNVKAWSALVTRTPYVLWGHGPSGDSRSRRPKDYAEIPIVRGARHVITYLPGGKDSLVATTGSSPDRVTPYMNSTDTAELLHARSRLTPAGHQATRDDLGIDDASLVALYVGAFDTSKRVDLLVEMAERASALDSRFRLILAGRGPDEDKVKALAASNPSVMWMGYADRDLLAALAAISHAMVIPGRVGLVAVDALALSLPIVTTSDASHAPEIQYLREGETVHYSPGEASSLAELLLSVLKDQRLSPNSAREADVPSIERSADIMSNVILRCLGQAS